jgi:hypothetical protein
VYLVQRVAQEQLFLLHSPHAVNQRFDSLVGLLPSKSTTQGIIIYLSNDNQSHCAKKAGCNRSLGLGVGAWILRMNFEEAKGIITINRTAPGYFSV